MPDDTNIPNEIAWDWSNYIDLGSPVLVSPNGHFPNPFEFAVVYLSSILLTLQKNARHSI